MFELYELPAAEEAEGGEAGDGGGGRPPGPSNWKAMAIRQEKHWKLRSGRGVGRDPGSAGGSFLGGIVELGIRQLDRGGTMAAGISRPFLGPTRALCVECPRLVDLSLLNLAHSSQPPFALLFGSLALSRCGARSCFPGGAPANGPAPLLSAHPAYRALPLDSQVKPNTKSRTCGGPSGRRGRSFRAMPP